MKERPILMSAPMVRAILEGRKSQTRRVVKPEPPPQPAPNCHPLHKAIHPEPYLDAYCGGKKTEKNPRGMGVEWCWWQVDDRQCLPAFRCPYGIPGDRLWVREAHAILPATAYRGSREEDGSQIPHRESGDGYYWSIYREGWSRSAPRWSPSIHMPRWASRLTLEIKSVRVERLQEISEEDARAEGISDGGCLSCGESEPCGCADPEPSARDTFAYLWHERYGDSDKGWHSNPWVWVIQFERIEDA